MPPAKRKPTPTIKIEMRQTADLLPDPNNANLHDAKSIQAIRASYRKWGQQKPIVVDSKGIVVAGNGQLEAAIAEGWEWIECKVFSGSTDEARAYAIADNRTAQFATWDEQMLAQTLQLLDDDLRSAAGFEQSDVDKLLAGDTAPMEGEADTEGDAQRWGLIVECEGERQQVLLMERLEEEGFNVRPMIS